MTAQHAIPPLAPEPSDAEVIAEVLAGDRSRYAVLVRRHNQRVFRACRAVLRNDQEAEDAVQVAWLNAFRALASFRADASFRTWVTRIAVNEATSRLRQQRRLSAVALEQPRMNESDSPERTLYTKELAHMLEREIDALPEGLRSVLVLRDVIELDTAETAGCLGIEDDNVRVRLHRARQALAARLTTSVDEAFGAAMPELWRFDGERCARMLERVMQQISQR
ncbi:MAG: RNA polymerase sigma factor [Deltaproteobacteria bacterium]|nr:RNA polymerase sigma factor [Deltaproteobacteria bacterium]